jgi:hypothetical protein
LRYESEITDDWAGHVGSPHGRTRLGRWANREPAYKLDLDGDQKRDIGWWEPPSTPGTFGTFRVLLSTYNFSTSAGQSITATMGRLGDIPIPGDYNGDGRTDLAVFRPGGGASGTDPTDATGRWYYCSTNATSPPATTCTIQYDFKWHVMWNPISSSTILPCAWGAQGIVPLGGIGTDWRVSYSSSGLSTMTYYEATDDAASGTLRFKTSAASACSGQTSSVQSASWKPKSMAFPVRDIYGDGLPEILIVHPNTAAALIVRSETGYTTQTAIQLGTELAVIL